MFIWVSRIIVLGSVWWLCSGIAQPFFAAMAVLSIGAVLLILHRMKLLAPESSLMPNMIGAALYLPWLLKEIYKAALSVTRLIWQVTPSPKPVLGWVETHLKSQAALTAYGNSITLTPGTICADVVQEKERNLMLVHALDASGLADLHTRRMEKKLRPRFDTAATKKKAAAWW